jgi:hypothetical protein
VLCYLDLETLRERDGGGPAPMVVDFKVKNSLIRQDQADSDPQAGLYLAGRWLEDYPASELCFAQIAKPGICRFPHMPGYVAPGTMSPGVRDVRRRAGIGLSGST